jgi:predicted ester cyclase
MNDFDVHSFYASYIDVLNARQFERLEEFVHDEIAYFTDVATRDQVAAAIAGSVDVVPDLRWELRDLVVAGDTLAARLVNTGTPVANWLGVSPTGDAFEITELAVYRVRDGRFTHMTNVHDAAALAAQLAA